MKLLELKKQIDFLVATQMKHRLDPDVGVILYSNTGFGGTKISKIKNISKGFDFDRDKVIIKLEQEVDIVK